MEVSAKKRKAEEANGVVDIAVEDARKMLEPFTREQLLDILQEAATQHLDVLEQVRAIADKDPAQRKLFVRGLGWDTNTESLKALFSQFGELEEGVVIMDKNTGKSKGYGFVTFKHMDGALNALKEPSKKIDGRMTVSQLASAGSQPAQPAADVSARKIYVGNVPMDMAADRLLSLFSQYGEIEEGPLGFDKQSGRSRGFALFIFKSVDATKRALEEPMKTIDGHQMFCKLAGEGQKPKPGGINVPGGPDGSDINGLNQPGNVIPSNPGMQYGGMGHGFVNPALGVNQGSNPTGLAAHQGLSHHGLGSSALSGLGGHPNPSGMPGGSMNHPMNPSSMNPGLSSHGGMHGGSGQVPTSLGMGGYGGHGGGLGPYGGPPQAGGYGGGQTAGGYGGIGGGGSLYGVPPTSGASQSGGFPEGSHYPLSSYQNQHQQSGQSPAPRVPGGGVYQGVPPFYSV